MNTLEKLQEKASKLGYWVECEMATANPQTCEAFFNYSTGLNDEDDPVFETSSLRDMEMFISLLLAMRKKSQCLSDNKETQ